MLKPCTCICLIRIKIFLFSFFSQPPRLPSSRASTEGEWFDPSQVWNWHIMFLPWLTLPIWGLHEEWLVRGQYKVPGWGIMFNLRHGTSVCWDIKTRFESGPVQQMLHPLSYIIINCWERIDVLHSSYVYIFFQLSNSYKLFSV